MMKQTEFHEDGVTVSRFAHITRSVLAQRLMELEEEGKLGTLTIPFDGDADRAHIRTRSIRFTMARHGYRLYYKREPGTLRLWAKKDPKINGALYITKPRRKDRLPGMEN